MWRRIKKYIPNIYARTYYLLERLGQRYAKEKF